MANFPSKQLDQFTVRFPGGLRDRIKDAAAANNRSMNAEIVATLEEKYPAEREITFGDMVLLLDTLKRLGRNPEIESQEEYDNSLMAMVRLFNEMFPDSAPAALKELGYVSTK